MLLGDLNFCYPYYTNIRLNFNTNKLLYSLHILILPIILLLFVNILYKIYQ